MAIFLSVRALGPAYDPDYTLRLCSSGVAFDSTVSSTLPLADPGAAVVVAVGYAHERVHMEALGDVVVEEHSAVVVEFDDEYW